MRLESESAGGEFASVVVARLTEQGSSLLLVEQFIDRALALADHVYLLQKGEVTWSGAASQLRHSDLIGHYLGHRDVR